MLPQKFSSPRYDTIWIPLALTTEPDVLPRVIVAPVFSVIEVWPSSVFETAPLPMTDCILKVAYSISISICEADAVWTTPCSQPVPRFSASFLILARVAFCVSPESGFALAILHNISAAKSATCESSRMYADADASQSEPSKAARYATSFSWPFTMNAGWSLNPAFGVSDT